jgi:hypothetical protein
MEKQWKSNKSILIRSGVILLLNEEWVLEIEKWECVCKLRKIGSIKEVLVFRGCDDFENIFMKDVCCEIEDFSINSDSFFGGLVRVKFRNGKIEEYKCVVNLETCERKIEKLKGGN